MTPTILLDSGPLSTLASPKSTPDVLACKLWANRLEAAGRRVIVPEATDYETRRELVRGGKLTGLALLDGLAVRFEYLPLTTAVMRQAADLWAAARQRGRPTASDAALDVDVILAAQALAVVGPVIVATTNVGHLAQFVPADLWSNITP